MQNVAAVQKLQSEEAEDGEVLGRGEALQLQGQKVEVTDDDWGGDGRP
jgi:hypothetical protein